MKVTFDPVKAKTNILKQGVDFADAAGALEDPHAVTIEDEEIHAAG